MTGAADKAAADELFASGRAAAGEPEVLDCGKYAGMTTMEARKAILEDLKAGGGDSGQDAHPIFTSGGGHSDVPALEEYPPSIS